MRCAECGYEISGKPYREDGRGFCSLECANASAGSDTFDDEVYFDEEPPDGCLEEEDQY